jgi:ubiquinone/menaquinone biosynthesis C-methylase UbiE
MSEQDQWSTWLLHTRFAGDPDAARRGLAQLHDIRGRILRNARLRSGETLLDVGCGDGLIGFGALDTCPTARVIFSDISKPLLEHCEQLARGAGLDDRCTFVEAAADDLRAIPDASVDVVTMRSVLIYVKRKAEAFAEFHRVLRPGGRLALFEPINRFGEIYPLAKDWWGTEGTPVENLARRLRDHFRSLQPLESDPMMDFDQHDLLSLAESAGFPIAHLAYHVIVTPSPPASWEAIINSPGNPNIPSVAEAMQQILSADERARFEAHVKPRVEAGGSTMRSAVAYLTATRVR